MSSFKSNLLSIDTEKMSLKKRAYSRKKWLRGYFNMVNLRFFKEI